MDLNALPDNPYILLTPGPLSTSKGVKAAMLRDWCTWDEDYNQVVQDVRARLVNLGGGSPAFTSVLLQGSGTFCVEAAVGTALPPDGRLLVLANGSYGRRIGTIAQRLRLDHRVLDLGELARVEPGDVARALDQDPAVTHVAVVHCETTTGMFNPVREIGVEVKKRGKIYIVDAMSSFGGMPMDLEEIGCHFLISSANKCIQGVPGFGFILARRAELEKCRDNARSLSLDLFDQWQEMERGHGKWRYTSPTHVVRAFAQALRELEEEGGPAARLARYTENRDILVRGMASLGFECLLPAAIRSPFITSFRDPAHPGYDFRRFYDELKGRGWVIYPGKVTSASTFRIGNIGHVFPEDMRRLLGDLAASMYWTR